MADEVSLVASRTPSESFGSELIPDHALVVGERDLFAHEDYVGRLMAVIDEVSIAHTSANVALYGSWGSGKSGVSNLLEQRLDGKGDRFHYVYFDAFKYAREPLLRNFISQLAHALLSNEKAEGYHRRLYQETSQAHLSFPTFEPQKRKRVHSWLIRVGIGLLAVLVGLFVVPEGRVPEFLLDLVGGALAALVPTAVLVAAIGLAARYLTVTTTVGAPGSEEEFERVFADLLGELGIDGEGDERLVVFVDELDRCAPDEVAGTLETLRTFLGVKGCIFVVAADQQVLEHALTERVRQATPADAANPYYSAGNAYLDKIFQYQLAFPPVRVRRLTHFALELLEGRGGIWQRVNREEVVPSLLPTHIQSPRRVKVLLNSFALTYGIAEARVERKQLAPDLPGRSSELAKMVCLRAEFPLFARDLALDSRLTEAVVAAAELLESGGEPLEDEWLRRLPVEVRERAMLYAKGELPGAQFLAETAAEPAPHDPLLDYDLEESDSDGVNDQHVDEAAAGEDEPPTREMGSGAHRQTRTPIRRAHALQLIRYLEKTRDIRGPGNDFIHLEAAGAIWGLDPQVAEEIERDALDNRPSDIVRVIRALDQQDERQRATLMLGQLARESVGSDADNVVRALLRTVAESAVELDSIAASLVHDIETYHRRRNLRAENLPGALSLALRGKSSAFTRSLLGHDAAVGDERFRTHILVASDELWPEHSDRLTEVCSAGLRLTGDSAASAILGLRPETSEPLLLAVGAPVRDVTSAELKSDDEETVAQGAAVLEEIVTAIRVFSAERRYRLAEFVLIPLLDLPGSEASDHAIEFVEALSPLETDQASAAVLAWTANWELGRFAPLLGSLDPALTAGLSEGPELLDRLGCRLWIEVHEGSDDIPDDLADRIEAFREAGLVAHGDQTPDTITKTLGVPIPNAAVAEEHRARAGSAWQMAELGLVPREVVANALCKAVALTALEAVPAVDEAAVISLVTEWLREAAVDASVESLREVEQAVASENCWISSPERQGLSLLSAAELAERDEAVEVPLVDEMVALTQEHGEEFSVAVGIWIEHFADDPADVFRLSRPFLSEPSDAFLAALSQFSANLRPRQRAVLTVPAIEQAFVLDPADSWFAAAHLDEASDKEVATALVDLFGDAGNDERRRRVLRIWQLAAPGSKSLEHLILEVFLPIAEHGTQGFELSVRYLPLCERASGEVRRQLIERLTAAAPDDKRKKRLRNQLEQMGWLDKPKGWLRNLFG